MSLLFNKLSRLVIAFLPRSKYLLISWLQSPSAVILEPKKIKPVIVYIVSLSICHEVMGPDAIIFIFWMLSFKPAFSLSCLVPFLSSHGNPCEASSWNDVVALGDFQGFESIFVSPLPGSAHFTCWTECNGTKLTGPSQIKITYQLSWLWILMLCLSFRRLWGFQPGQCFHMLINLIWDWLIN